MQLGLAIASRMTAQVNGLNMAVKNANDGIALTQSIEGALVEVSDMVQRIRELSVQASNDTNTDSDRAFIQEEVNLLIAEITRISSNTRYNGQLVLDGSFTNRQMQVGTEGGETITVNVDSVASDMLGAYEITGDRIEAFNGNGAGSYGNITDAADDIIINGNSLSKTIDVAAGDSARAVAG
jgi:flagellin